MIQAGFDLKDFLHSSFHGTKKYCARFQGNEAGSSPTQLQHPMNHNSDHHGRLSIKVLGTVQRSIDHGESRSIGLCICTTAPVSMARETSWKKG